MSKQRWLRLHAQSPSPEQTDALIEGLIASGAIAAEQKGDTVITYVSDPEDAEAAAHDLERSIREFMGVAIPVEWSWVDDEDWTREWRRGLGARRVGKRMVVTPTWIDPQAQPHEIVLTIDPQMAFGTGEHGTTRGMLRLMELAIRDGDVVLDVGAGSAILAIAATKLGAASADAVEYDPDAIENATENIERNGAADQVTLACELVDVAYLDARRDHYDVIVANVLSSVLRPLLRAFNASLKSNGRLLLSGILQTEADVMIGAAAAADFDLVMEDREDEWWSCLLVKRGHP